MNRLNYSMLKSYMNTELKPIPIYGSYIYLTCNKVQTQRRYFFAHRQKQKASDFLLLPDKKGLFIV